MKTLFVLIIFGGTLILSSCASPQWKQINAGRRFQNERKMPTAARANFEAAVKIATEKNDPYALAVANQEIGFTYMNAEHDFGMAKQYFGKAIAVSEPNGFNYLLAEHYYNTANICNQQAIFLKQDKFPPACLKHGCANLKKSRDQIALARAGDGKPPKSEKAETISNLENVVSMLSKSYSCD
jgi:hypothetical protein